MRNLELVEREVAGSGTLLCNVGACKGRQYQLVQRSLLPLLCPGLKLSAFTTVSHRTSCQSMSLGGKTDSVVTDVGVDLLADQQCTIN